MDKGQPVRNVPLGWETRGDIPYLTGELLNPPGVHGDIRDCP